MSISIPFTPTHIRFNNATAQFEVQLCSNQPSCHTEHDRTYDYTEAVMVAAAMQRDYDEHNSTRTELITIVTQ